MGTVDSYLEAVPPEQRRALTDGRAAIRSAAPDAEELISYRIPLYKLDGKHLIGFAAAKNHLSLYVMDSSAQDDFAEELARFDQAGTKATIRFTADNPIPAALVKKIVRRRVAEVRG